MPSAEREPLARKRGSLLSCLPCCFNNEPPEDLEDDGMTTLQLKAPESEEEVKVRLDEWKRMKRAAQGSARSLAQASQLAPTNPITGSGVAKTEIAPVKEVNTTHDEEGTWRNQAQEARREVEMEMGAGAEVDMRRAVESSARSSAASAVAAAAAAMAATESAAAEEAAAEVTAAEVAAAEVAAAAVVAAAAAAVAAAAAAEKDATVEAAAADARRAAEDAARQAADAAASQAAEELTHMVMEEATRQEAEELVRQEADRLRQEVERRRKEAAEINALIRKRCEERREWEAQKPQVQSHRSLSHSPLAPQNCHTRTLARIRTRKTSSHAHSQKSGDADDEMKDWHSANMPLPRGGGESCVWLEVDARESDDAWVPAVVDRTEGGFVHLKSTASGRLSTTVSTAAVEEATFVQLKPVAGDANASVSDLLGLADISEPAVLHNLRLRYAKDQIYTRVGSTTLISVNPYKEVATSAPGYFSGLQRRVSLSNQVLSPRW